MLIAVESRWKVCGYPLLYSTFLLGNFILRSLGNWLADAKLYKPGLTVFREKEACRAQTAIFPLGTMEDLLF